MNKKTRIILVGAGGSGKDYLKQKFIDKGYEPSVSFTTRAPRDGEIFGKDYFFCSKEQFESKILNNEFYEWKNFNGWFYGTLREDYDKKDLFIMTPLAINEMSNDIRKNSMVIYLDIAEDIRHRRLISRNDIDDTNRRLRTDKEMFQNFKNYDLRITNSDF